MITLYIFLIVLVCVIAYLFFLIMRLYKLFEFVINALNKASESDNFPETKQHLILMKYQIRSLFKRKSSL